MDVTVTGSSCALPALPDADVRLSRRYTELWLAHLSTADFLAAGFHANPGLASSFAATQAAWRFLNNDAITLPMLAGPLLECARQDIPSACDDWLLVPMDWCHLHYNTHGSKANRMTLSRPFDQGYKLLTALAISDRDGSPLAPLCLELTAANGVHSTRSDQPMETASTLDALEPVMSHVRNSLGSVLADKPPVFIIDAEADSVGHYRNWNLSGHQYLICADSQPHVLYNSQKMPLGKVADSLKQDAAFTLARTIDFKGGTAEQFVAETSVVLVRPARTHRVDKTTGKLVHKNIAGEAITLRLIVSEARNKQGKVLARWLLLTSLPPGVDAATIAKWYYWRWRIETYHKLLKGAGQQLEQWQQETPEAMARRLAVVAMACVVTWRLARDQTPAAGRMREVLVKLSGRQMKRGKNQPGFTAPALLAGLGILIPMLLLLEQHDLSELRELAKQLLPGTIPDIPRHTRRRKVV